MATSKCEAHDGLTAARGDEKSGGVPAGVEKRIRPPPDAKQIPPAVLELGSRRLREHGEDGTGRAGAGGVALQRLLLLVALVFCLTTCAHWYSEHAHRRRLEARVANLERLVLTQPSSTSSPHHVDRPAARSCGDAAAAARRMRVLSRRVPVLEVGRSRYRRSAPERAPAAEDLTQRDGDIKHARDTEKQDGRRSSHKEDVDGDEGQEGVVGSRDRRARPRLKRTKITAVHFEGHASFVEADPKDGGYVSDWRPAPWVRELRLLNNNDYKMPDTRDEVLVHRAGLYYVYAQISFYNNESTNGFGIFCDGKLVFKCTLETYLPKDSRHTHTCHVSGVTFIPRDAAVYVRHYGGRRVINMDGSITHFGLVKLAEVTNPHLISST